MNNIKTALSVSGNYLVYFAHDLERGAMLRVCMQFDTSVIPPVRGIVYGSVTRISTYDGKPVVEIVEKRGRKYKSMRADSLHGELTEITISDRQTVSDSLFDKRYVENYIELAKALPTQKEVNEVEVSPNNLGRKILRQTREMRNQYKLASFYREAENARDNLETELGSKTSKWLDADSILE